MSRNSINLFSYDPWSQMSEISIPELKSARLNFPAISISKICSLSLSAPRKCQYSVASDHITPVWKTNIFKFLPHLHVAFSFAHIKSPCACHLQGHLRWHSGLIQTSGDGSTSAKILFPNQVTSILPGIRIWYLCGFIFLHLSRTIYFFPFRVI